VTTINTSSFRNWLVDSYGLKTKSAGDAVSRLNRALNLQDADSSLVASGQVDVFVSNLNSNSAFLSLPVSSQAGILRSLKLYRKFISR
jgi:hypothetical protein